MGWASSFVSLSHTHTESREFQVLLTPRSSLSADYMQGTHVKFNSKQDAIAFCEKQGWEFYVQEPNVQKFEPKSYAK